MHTFSHTFHIPVMGLAYTIDSPIKVARFGINSAISIIEDNLLEMMRKYYCRQYNEPYLPIGRREQDSRARRITSYLDLVNRIVNTQVEKLRSSAFQAGSEIIQYFEMLPEIHPAKNVYHKWTTATPGEEKQALESLLRKEIRPGAIEVNIMTKIDKINLGREGLPIKDGSDAVSALRGYARSNLKNSSVIFSAGMNPRLFSYLETLPEFDARDWGIFNKKVIIKVSDYRSALVQGKFLGKKGIWVSEFRIESGLNCGGHTFPTDGTLLGPILEEFKNKKDELIQSLFEVYHRALQAKGKPVFEIPHPVKISVQGGIGTHEEDQFLHEYYGMESTGWGTPFLLCPEATTVDDATLQKLSAAREKDVVLGNNSPLGVRFNYLKGTSGEKERLQRIAGGSPGSPCTEKFLVSDTEFTKEPICTASRKYQRLKIRQLESMNLPEDEFRLKAGEVYSKECLCVGLSNSAAIVYHETLVKNQTGVTMCPGPNIAYFSKVVSLREITDHIYGRSASLQRADRPHMFIKELQLYIDYLREMISGQSSPDSKFIRYCRTFSSNLVQGIAYYQDLIRKKEPFLSANLLEQPLTELREEITKLPGGQGLSSACQEA